MATGRSDYPNQINNVLCFPGFFRGLLDCRASGHRRDEDRRRPGHRVRGDPQGLHEEYIIPSVFNKKVALAVARGRARGPAAVARRRRQAAPDGARPRAMSDAFAELAKRTEEITPFLAVEVFERAQELERQGHDVVHLEFGEPDFETPEVVREAAVRAIREGRTKYAHSLGILPLRGGDRGALPGDLSSRGVAGPGARDRRDVPGDAAPLHRAPVGR